MVELSVAEGKLTLSVMGADKLWALKSSLEIPLVHFAGVRPDTEVARAYECLGRAYREWRDKKWVR